MRPLELFPPAGGRGCFSVSGVSGDAGCTLDLPEDTRGRSGTDVWAGTAGTWHGLFGVWHTAREVLEHGRAQNGRFYGYVQGPGEPVVPEVLATAEEMQREGAAG